jgi:hypothetical protein
MNGLSFPQPAQVVLLNGTKPTEDDSPEKDESYRVVFLTGPP